MANSIYSTDQQVWKDILDENWGTISALIAARVRNSSQLEVVSTLTEFHTLLVNYSHGGVSKIQRTTIETLVKMIDADIEELIERVETFLAQAQANEQTRINNEVVRQTDEVSRETNESTRQSNEASRVTAESARVSQWTTWFTNGVTEEWEDWFSDVLATGVRKMWNDFWSGAQSDWSNWTAAEASRVAAEIARAAAEATRVTAEQARVAAETAREQQASSDHTRAEADHSTATSDHTASVTATNEASNVNAQLSGMTVTITNRQGTSSSINIGFEIYKTYSSKALMKADAANVPQGKWVVIGSTTNPTDPDNATLWQRNALAPDVQEPLFPFDLLSDLDQASSAAWADWLENMKPAINERIATADADHTQAVSDHSTATQDHTTAQADHTQAVQDHTTADADHTIALSDHSTAQTDHTTAEADHVIADADHQTASTDHGTAATDHQTAESDHQTAEADHTASVAATTAANTEANRARGYNDHPWELRNDGYIWAWDEDYDNGDGTFGAMVITNKVLIPWDQLTPTQQQQIIDNVAQGLVFATVQECRDAMNELT